MRSGDRGRRDARSPEVTVAVLRAVRATLRLSWDADRIAQVVVNALDYAPTGAPVDVAVDGADERVVLAVTNEGPRSRRSSSRTSSTPSTAARTRPKAALRRGLG
jgi:signal transduction histidine kinase